MNRTITDETITVETARDLFSKAVRHLESVLEEPYAGNLDKAVHAIVNCYRNGGKLLIFGNGGSAADAQHIAGELIGRFKLERKSLPAISLSTDTSILTAWSNDYSFETVFARQIEGLGRPGDVAWGITTSGNSPNVIAALKKSKELGLTTIAMTGNSGGKAAGFSDILLTVASEDTPRIQEAHLLGYHIICKLVEERLFL